MLQRLNDALGRSAARPYLRSIIIAAILICVAEHYLWSWAHWRDSVSGGELPEVARAFSRTFTFSDAYKPGQGPTAHVMPLPAIFAGLVYRYLGIATTPAEFVLLTAAIAWAIASFWLGYRVMGELGSPPLARLAGLLALLLLPLNIGLESRSFRIWEGAMAATLGLAFLLLLLRYDRLRRIDPKSVAVLAFSAAILLFISPPLGVPAYCGCLIFMVARQPARQWWRTILIAIGALLIVLAPWTIRNAIVLGHPIPLRSNFGLEIAVGMNPDAVHSANPNATFHERLSKIHPFSGTEGYARMKQAGGEVAYANQLKQETFAWMRSHPGDAATLVVRHMREYFFPSPWMWEVVWRGPFATGGPQIVINWAVTALGLIGAISLAISRGRRPVYALLILLMPVLLYALTQPIPRYRYIGAALLMYFAADWFGRFVLKLPDAGQAGGEGRQ